MAGAGLLPLWWTLWLLTNFLGNMSFCFSMGAEELNEIISASGVMLASDFVDIPLSLALAFLVNGINNMLMAHVHEAGQGLRDSARHNPMAGFGGKSRARGSRRPSNYTSKHAAS